MSREVKFRVWDKDLKKMHICGENQHDSISFSYPENEAHYYNLQNGCGSSIDGSGTYELMQYTGLKDKHGKEIYEGDILTSTEYPFQDDGKYNYHGVVEWGEDEAAYYLTKHLVNKNRRGISHGISEMLGQEDLTTFEIIGNIYENPELLEETA